MLRVGRRGFESLMFGARVRMPPRFSAAAEGPRLAVRAAFCNKPALNPKPLNPKSSILLKD